uniref:Uncharacterized protein n=1 Tax=Cacopsylla melanoneura TaxID=428564 RepID=A0A8D8T2Y4_9HEMI
MNPMDSGLSRGVCLQMEFESCFLLFFLLWKSGLDKYVNGNDPNMAAAQLHKSMVQGSDSQTVVRGPQGGREGFLRGRRAPTGKSVFIKTFKMLFFLRLSDILDFNYKKFTLLSSKKIA